MFGRMLLLCAAAPILLAADLKPLVVVLGTENRSTWEEAAAERGWLMLANSVLATDAGMKALEAQVAGAVQRFSADPARVCLVGLGDGAAPVFLAVSRLPHLWAAALAIEGTPRTAIQSNRLFGVNSQLVPLLWYVTPAADLEPLQARLKAANFNVEARAPEGATVAQALEWLAPKRRDPAPPAVDCETGNTVFGRCYWLEITGFDASKRNDVLGSTRVSPGSGASLDLGGFGYQLAAPGPGLEVAWLPSGYRGPLRMNDRIVAVAGRPIANARDYAAYMDALTEEKSVAVTVERGKQRQRIESRVVLPKREELVTARISGSWIADSKEVQIITRAVSRLRVTVAPGWAPALITWNGTEVAKAEAGGCWELNGEREPATAKPCQ